MIRRLSPESAFGPIAALIAGRGVDVAAQSSRLGSVTRTEILRQAHPSIPGREVVVFSVEYAPGAGSTRHRHPGRGFVYVARGAVVSQLDTRPPVTYDEGQMWHEPPGSIHNTSRNASVMEPRSLLSSS